MTDASGLNSIEISEHISPEATADNIGAKRSANYDFGTDLNWARTPLPLIDAAFDNLHLSNPDVNGNYQTIVFKNGLSTIRTLTLAYDGSNNVTDLSRA